MTTASHSPPKTSTPLIGSRRWRVEEYIRTVDRNRFIPITPHARQRQFLLLGDVPEVFYGGAAGGGKTVATLAAAAQYVHVPGYAALLLRENFADLNHPESWIPLSKAWWMKLAHWSATDRRWTFPSGATITFGYLERDDSVYQYDTAAFQCIAIDELTQHTEWRYTFMFGRLRRKSEGPLAGVPLRMRSGANPGNKGHAWVKRRFINEETRPADCAFVPAKLSDNPGIDAESYRKQSLAKLDPLTRKQREEGDWGAIEGGRFKPEWFPRYGVRGDHIIFQKPGETQERTYNIFQLPMFITCDPAASAKTTADYTVAGVWLQTPLNEIALLDTDRFQADIPDIVPRLERQWHKWRRHPGGVWIESVAANNAVFKLAARTAMPARSLDPLGQDKLVRATPAMNYAATGRVWLPTPGLVPGMPLDEIESELYRFTGDDKKDANDDAVDMVSYAVRVAMGNSTAPSPAEAVPMVMGGMYR